MANAPWYVGTQGFPQTPRRSGMFGGRDWGQVAADFLANFSAAQGSPFGQAIVQGRIQERQDTRQAQARELARRQGLDDQFGMWQHQQEYTQAHPAPQPPTQLEQLMRLGNIDPASDQGREMARSAAAAAANPPVAVDVQLPDGSTERRWITRPLPQAPAVLTILPPNARPLPAGGAASGPRNFR